MNAKATVEQTRCVGVSDKAIRVRFVNGRCVWVPKSAIHDDSEVYQMDDFGKLVIVPWFAEQIGVGLD